MQKIYAFIDSQNLNLSIKNSLYGPQKNLIYKGWTLDFNRFRVYLKDKYNVQKAFLFIGRLPGYENLYSYLHHVGYSLVFKPTIPYSVGKTNYTKGNVDAELVLHTMMEYQNYDKAVIVSGDGDFHCLLKHLTTNNKLSKLLIPNRYSYSSLLREFRKYMVFVSDLRTKLEKK